MHFHGEYSQMISTHTRFPSPTDSRAHDSAHSTHMHAFPTTEYYGLHPLRSAECSLGTLRSSPLAASSPQQEGTFVYTPSIGPSRGAAALLWVIGIPDRVAAAFGLAHEWHRGLEFAAALEAAHALPAGLVVLRARSERVRRHRWPWRVRRRFGWRGGRRGARWRDWRWNRGLRLRDREPAAKQRQHHELRDSHGRGLHDTTADAPSQQAARVVRSARCGGLARRSATGLCL